MSVRDYRLNRLQARIRSTYQAENNSKGISRFWYAMLRWLYMLQYEWMNDDVRIRAQSMAFLMIFSLLPLIAGGFFLFSIFAQFGMVQDVVQGALNRFLGTIPGTHREFVLGYILQFKDQYLSNIGKQSGTIGIFALLILGWVGLQTFSNIDHTLNRIWSSEWERPLWEKIRNFVVVCVLAPIVFIGTLSVPLVLQNIAEAQPVFSRLSILITLLNYLLTPALVLLTFLCLYRYIPVRPVAWRVSLVGATFSTLLLLIANELIRIYFEYGTNSAYGKLAVVPLLGYWIYILWVIAILGAEVSYIFLHQREMVANDEDVSLEEARGLLVSMAALYRAHLEAKNPVFLDDLKQVTGLNSTKLKGIIKFLEREHYALRCVTDVEGDEAFVVARDVSNLKLSDLLETFLNIPSAENARSEWHSSLRHWMNYYENRTVKSWVADSLKPL